MQKINELDLRTIEAEEPTAFIVISGIYGGGCTLYKSNFTRQTTINKADALIENGEWDYAEVVSIEKAVIGLLDNEDDE